MRLVLGTNGLLGLGGSETYAVTVAGELQRLGHDVVLYAAETGEAAEHAAALGLRVATAAAALPDAVDAVIVQDGAVACDLALSHPLVPQLFVAHSDVFDLQLPPEIPGLVQVVVTLYDRVDERIRALATGREVVRLAQPVDVTRFTPLRPLRARAEVALALGNYTRGPRAEVLEEACRIAGVELRRQGIHAGGATRSPELAYNDADIVFGKARVIVEAMACGRAAYVFDHNGADGWVTPDRYAELAADNFGGQRGPAVTDARAIAEDLARYEPGLGLAGRDLAVAHHAASRHAARLVEVLQGLIPRPAPVDAPLFELARTIRLAHRQDSRQFALQAEVERLHGAVRERDVALEEARVQLERVHAEAARDRAAQDEALGAAHAYAGRVEARAQESDARVLAVEERAVAAEQAYTALVATRRWKALQRVLRPLDRLHAARRAEPVAPAAPSPVPFIVGVPRSGTTLLRLQFDAHPDLAIGPESGIGFVLAGVAPGATPEQLVDTWAEMSTFSDYGWSRDELVALLQTVRPWSVRDGVRAIFAAYAGRFGKPRWGEKTPTHVRLAATLADVLPEAHVIHVVRDGRGVARSVRGLHFAPGDGSIEAIAADWRDSIVGIRDAHTAGRVPHYREVRYERLLHEPEAVLRELCEWLALPFDPAILRAHERARERFAELPESRVDGSVVRTREQRWAIHAMTAQPPDPAEDLRWRAELTPEEIERFEAVAGDLLAELGYELLAGAVAR